MGAPPATQGGGAGPGPRPQTSCCRMNFLPAPLSSPAPSCLPVQASARPDLSQGPPRLPALTPGLLSRLALSPAGHISPAPLGVGTGVRSCPRAAGASRSISYLGHCPPGHHWGPSEGQALEQSRLVTPLCASASFFASTFFGGRTAPTPLLAPPGLSFHFLLLLQPVLPPWPAPHPRLSRPS